MVRYKLFFPLLIWLITSTKCSDAKNNIILQKSQPYLQDRSFISKIASWIFPNKQEPSSGHGEYQYPPPSYPQDDRNCNPCNLEPWIPIAGHNKHTSSQFHLDSLPNKQIQEYSPPNPTNIDATIPVFIPPPSNGEIFVVDYMLPPPVHFKLPPVLYGPPKHTYTPPAANSLGPPPKDTHGTPFKPPRPEYHPPRPIYGPPRPNYIQPSFPQEFLIPPTQKIQTTFLHPVPHQQEFFPDNLIPHNHLPRPDIPPPSQTDTSSHSSIGLSNHPLESNYIPPPVPSDSYGNPTTGEHFDLNQPYDSLPAPSGDSDYVDQRLPNLNHPPKYGYTDFRQGDTNSVQVQQSVQVADYLASIEHPINVIQSPLVEVEVKEDPDQRFGYNRISKTHHDGFNAIQSTKLSENPIVVDDIQTAASTLNGTIARSNSIRDEYTISKYQKTAPKEEPSTKKTKQIIVPYMHNRIPTYQDGYTTLVPVYTPPMPTEQSDWSKYLNDIESTRLTKVAKPFTSTAVYNIKDLIDANGRKQVVDVVTLQKSINDWTQQSYYNNKQLDSSHPKQIPRDYLTTPSTSNSDVFDHHPEESSRKETVSDDIGSNLIVAADSNVPDLPEGNSKSSWRDDQVTVSPHSKEKVYVVTPQAYSFVTAGPAISWSMAPKVVNGTWRNGTQESRRFSVRVEPEDERTGRKLGGDKMNLKVVYSEWPHLINDLQPTSTTKGTSAHPLFGLMGISAYTPPPNSTVETFDGHSKVITIVTPGIKETSTAIPTPKT